MTLVAIVDDSRLARTFAAACLKQAGYNVIEVEPSSLSEVLEKLREQKPALLILDQQMPTFSGSSLVRACFEDEEMAAIKVVMLTAHHDGDMEQRMEKLGVHAILHKPISPLELSRAVAALADGPGQIQGLGSELDPPG